jgi:hypothetical protein
MNNHKKLLVGAASVLALAAAGQTSAHASVPSFDKPVAAAQPATGFLASGTYSDPLFDLILRTKGDLASATVENTLMEMFSNASRDKIESLPQLLSDIMALGVAPETTARIRSTLVEIADSHSAIDEDVRESVIAQLNTEAGVIQIAVTNEKRRRPRDPDVVGQTGGGGGGGGGGY